MALPPFKLLAREFREGQIIPFLGAGASVCARPPDAVWDDSVQEFPPLGGELSLALAEECGFPAEEERLHRELSRVSSYYEHASVGRSTLRERLHAIFSRPYRPGPLHEFLSSVPKGLLIITTNYDTLIEQAFDAAGKPYSLVVYPTDRPQAAGKVLLRRAESAGEGFEEQPLAKLDLSCEPDDASVIFKMHGSVDTRDPDNGQYVITEEDYVTFLGRMTEKNAIPNDFLLPLQRRRLLFLGYGLEDWNFRVLLRSLNAVDASGRAGTDFVHWAIQRRVDEIEQRIWQRQSVNLADMDLNDFVAKLKQAGA